MRTDKELRQSSEIDLRVDGILQEEIYSDKQYMDDIKKQVAKVQDESKFKSMFEDLQKGNLLSEETSLKILQMGERRTSRSKTKNGNDAMSAMISLFGRGIPVLQMRCRFEDGRIKHFKNSKEISGCTWLFLLCFC